MAKELFLEILGCALHGRDFNADREISEEKWSEIFELARIHKVLPLVYDTCYKCDSLKVTDTTAIRDLSKGMIITQAIKTSAFLELLKGLERKNIPVIVVKGIACRRFYKNPDLRISSDEDLLLDKDHLKACKDFLCDSQFHLIGLDEEDGYQTSYKRVDGLHIEVHSSLFSAEKAYFAPWNKLFENPPTETFSYEGGYTVTTLSPTYGLLYLILHTLKHFLHTGVGIRQVCDIAMHAEALSDKIQWDYLFETLHELHATTFTKALFSLADSKLGFNLQATLPRRFLEDTASFEPLLEDILDSGIYGTSTLSRAHSSNFTKISGDKKKPSVLSKVFPSAKTVRRKYRYAKSPLLLPIAYVHRIVDYSGEVLKRKGSNPITSAKIGAQRAELIKYYSLTGDET